MARSAELRVRFVALRPVPTIDRGAGRSFHDPVIEIYEIIEPDGAGSAPADAPGDLNRS
jgi:hypothetical protein